MKPSETICLALISVMLLSFKVSGDSPPETSVNNICDVKAIHVGSVGEGTDLERYRHFVDKYLPEFGVPVVSNPAKADAILSGSFRVGEKIQGDMWLKTLGGVKLWRTEVTMSPSEAAVEKQAKKTAKRTAKHLRKQCNPRSPGRFTIGVQVGG